MQLLTSKLIEKKILENYIEYQHLFTEFQTDFLSGLYKRYQGLENGNLVLHYAKLAQLEILKQKNYDLNFNLCFENLWENHRLIDPQKSPIIKVAQDTSLAKETARRKISQLVKQKVLSKENNKIVWAPNEQYKKNYNLFVHQEIEGVSKIIIFICKKLDLFIFKEEIIKELKKNFSFYWYHYLRTQLEYLKIWSVQFKDLELVFIALQVISIFVRKAKEENLSHKDIYENSNVFNNFKSEGINATSVSEITGIPRATCVRKLETLIGLNIIQQDTISKQYYIAPSNALKNLIGKKNTLKIAEAFSNFYFICIRAITAKSSD